MGTEIMRNGARFAILAAALLMGAGVTYSAENSGAATPWPQPDPDKLEKGPWKDTVLYGRKLFTETYSVIGPEVSDKSMRYAGNNLSCQSCHLQGGTQRFAIPMIGVYGVFPTYIGRENEVRTLEERIEGCMERSMNGRQIPIGGKEMKALVSYIQFLSSDVPVGKSLQGRGSPSLPLMTRAADPKKGEEAFHNYCAECHQPDGQGKRRGMKGDAKGYDFPPLWGPDSFNDGAGMHRLIASASFIHANMPFGTRYDQPMLTNEEAWDVAAYVNSQPRPHRDHLDADYPDRSKKPPDAPFPPFVDNLPLQQHQYGPFQPIIDADKAAAAAK
jgi:thiosulfate dehydrogenase